MRPDFAEGVLHGHAAMHDRTQFEVTFTYDVSAANMSQDKNVERYRIEAFYFFPNNMGVTSLNFPREDFYRSLHGYIRFKTPIMAPRELLDPLNRQSPLNLLSFVLKRHMMGERLDAEEAEKEARLFGCVVSSLFKHHAGVTLHALEGSRGEASRWAEFEGLLFDFTASACELLERYRALLRDFRDVAQRQAPELWSHLRQVDEYLTYRFDDTLSELHFHLMAACVAPDDTERLASRLRAIAEQEGRHRSQAGYIALTPGDEENLALYTYRASALKKLVERVLYLDVKTIQETTRWRNLAAAAGATLAATFMAFSRHQWSAQLNSHWLFLAIIAYAFLYMVKDRIKEILREYVWKRVSSFFPDNRLLVHDPTKHLDIGQSTERTQYLQKSSLPKDVLLVRNFDHTIDLDEERAETVILYQSDVRLNGREILNGHQRRTHLKHILRFSVEDLLARMDNPTVRVRFYDAASRVFCRLRAPKVYHMNVVFRFTRWNDRNQAAEPTYQRVRVVLDKNGIRHIDQVVDAGRVQELTHRVPKRPSEDLIRLEEERLS
ncbi:MAG TPA: hypothetical protein V6D47_09690 [Oscillatoriaceae cyanobacterium]